MSVSFDISATEKLIVSDIVDRVAGWHRGLAKPDDQPLDTLSLRMDLIATHANGCPMDFARLAEADDFNLLHDVLGISRHIDRTTGKLDDGFLPRFARPAKPQGEQPPAGQAAPAQASEANGRERKP